TLGAGARGSGYLRAGMWAEDDARPLLVVILGAGASHDCIRAFPAADRTRSRNLMVSVEGLPTLRLAQLPPPPVSGLVPDADVPHQSRLLSEWPAALPLADYLVRRLTVASSGERGRTVTLEEALSDYRDNGGPEATRHLIAFRFYLRDLFWEATHYLTS